MKTRFYFIRHGETTWNSEKRYQGWTDIPLSDIGRSQAESLAQRFRHLPLDAIYSSPLQRAIQTAEPIAREKGLTVSIEEHFKEINFGEWEGMSISELKEMYGETFEAFHNDPFGVNFPGEGSFELVKKRSLLGVQQLLEKHRGQQVAVVSHGGLLRVLLLALFEFDNSFYGKTWLNNTSLTIVDFREGDKKILLTLNDKSHLEGGDL